MELSPPFLVSFLAHSFQYYFFRVFNLNYKKESYEIFVFHTIYFVNGLKTECFRVKRKDNYSSIYFHNLTGLCESSLSCSIYFHN